MNEEKQINELANDIAFICPDLADSGCMGYACAGCLARKLNEIGYRKHAWTSVEDALPDIEEVDKNNRPRSVRVLCVCKQRSGKVFVKEGYYQLWNNKVCWRIPGSIDSVTHWMPLPDIPGGIKND